MRKCPPAVMLLGAGCSFGATKGKCPLVKDFIGVLDCAKYPQLWGYIETLEPSKRTNLASVLEELDTIAEMPLGEPKHWITPSRIDPETVRRELANYCVERIGDAHRGPFTWQMGSIHNACVGGYTTFITTNYDTIADCAVSYAAHHRQAPPGTGCPRCKMMQILSAACPCPPARSVPPQYWRGALLKLHGSADWMMCRSNCCASGCIVANTPCTPIDTFKCISCGEPTERVVVLPRLRGAYDRYPKLSAMWDAAFQALQEAESLCVFGFSFSPDDRAVAQLFRNSLKSNALKRVTIMDVNVDAVADAVRRVLPSGLTPEMYGQDLPKDFSMGEEPWREL